ncbi:MAG: host attachment protein [Nitrospirae bacterium]|jgi:hypothetical protein|nr:host attachment protein [Nitrospirota bacterium]
MNIIIIIADLGHFKAYRVLKDPLKLESDKLELIRDYVSIETHYKSKDKFRDKPGIYKLGGGKGWVSSGFGESQAELETEKKLIKQIAESIDAVVREEDCEKWYFAAGGRINGKIIESLDPVVIAKLEKNIKSNLTKLAKSKILLRFSDIE